MNNERRKNLRIYRNFIISYFEKGRTDRAADISQVNDISKGGMCFSSTRLISEGSFITVDLKTSFVADSLELEGVVLECKEKVPHMLYEVRLQFQSVSEESLAVLEKIENYSKSREN